MDKNFGEKHISLYTGMPVEHHNAIFMKMVILTYTGMSLFAGLYGNSAII